MLAQKDHLLGARKDHGPIRHARFESALAQQPITERMEGADDAVRVAIRHQLIHPFLHLGGGLLGERQGQDLRRACTLLRDEPGDAAGEDGRLTRSGPRDNQQWAVTVRHRLALALGQVGEER